MTQRHDETTLSYRKTYIHPIGLVQRSKNEIELIAIHGHSVVAIPILAENYTESAYGSNYNYMGGFSVTKTKYKIGTMRNYFLLSTRDQEILFHYKWNKDFAPVQAYELLENIIEAMRDDLSEPPKGFIMVNEFNDHVINLLISEKAEVKNNMSHLIKTEKTHIEIHEDNLKEAKLLLSENLRNYKVWWQQ